MGHLNRHPTVIDDPKRRAEGKRNFNSWEKEGREEEALLRSVDRYINGSVDQ